MGLFTSHRNLQAVAAMMRDAIPKELLLVQGQLPKAKIIERFKLLHKRGKNAVLLGTQSFWQGVDIPGQALSVVVIDKIPFPRPDDPVLYHLDRIGRNSFRDYSLPKAIIAMKQGLGRLIRTEDDFGCVVLLDVRMSTKGYGRSLKTSLPNGCFVSDDTKDISAFLQQMQGS